MIRTCLIVDVHNLYTSADRKYPGSVLNYAELIKGFESTGNEILHRIAYGRQPEEKVRAFATMLRRQGFELSFGNTPHNIEMALKVAEMVERRAFDHLILGTNYFEAGRMLKYVRERGIKATAVGFELPQIFSQYAECLEIDDTMLQERPSNDVSSEGSGQPESLALAAAA